MTRKAHTFWLRFPDAVHWRRWESDLDNAIGVASEAARELRCKLPIAIEARRDNDGLVQLVTVMGVGPGIHTNGTVEEIQA